MKIFNGLTGGEIILLVLGIILFLALLFILIYMVLNKRNFKYLIGFFLVPVLMIGFSSIKKISYDNGVIDIEKETKQVNNNPNDKVARKILFENIENMESRASSDPSALVTISKARLSLGDTVKAHQSVNKAFKLKPDLVPARNLKISLDKRIKRIPPK
jgi:hypothetical protein